LLMVLDCLVAGVAFHHAGLDARDRTAIENGYLRGDLSVICCTSTLAVGVNLPCHLVIIKGTMSYQGGVMKEMSELDVLQMLGRAGRPQFDTSAVAVIMTRQEQANRWKQLVSGEEILESW
jgi:ATP-dependent DNA helicase HFM1/MER3